MSRHHIRQTEGPRGKRWHATVELGIDPRTGKRRQQRLTAATRRELDAEIARVLTDRAHGIAPVDPQLTLAAYLAQWLDAIGSTVKPGTLRTYRQRVDTWIIPRLGQRKLATISPLDIQRFTTAIIAAGRSSTTAEAVFGTLRAALSAAVKWGLLHRNPCSAVDAPKRDTPEMKTWSAAQVQTALAAATEPTFGLFWRLALTTGMRRGELLGLRWSDVDLERRTIAVRHTFVRGEKGKWESSTPKTAKSRRVITISAADVAALKQHRATQNVARLAADQWAGDLVFCDDAGQPLHQTSLQRAFAAFLSRTGLSAIRLHDLRHTHASLALAAGVNPKIVQERLGHATFSMTMDRYAHVMPSMQEQAVDQLEALLNKSSAARQG